MPTGPVGPYSASSTRPATIVGSANGRSIRPLTIRLPGNSSRTSTQAISVPITALIAATISETTSVSRIAACAWAFVTASQNSPTPPSNDCTTTAARGIRTISVSHATEYAPATSGPTGSRRARTRDSSPAVTALAGRGHPQVAVDLGDRALLGVEEVGVDLVPAAELVDLEERPRRRVCLLVDQVGEDRAVALGGVDLLRLGGHQPVEERLRLIGALRLGDDGRGVLDQDRLVGDDVVELDAGALRGDRLVLVGEQDVALAAGEGLQRLARRLVLHRRVGEHLVQEVERLLGRLALGGLGAVGRHQVPLGPA